MVKVRVNPDKLEEAADSISRQREYIERIIQELLQVTFELQMSWEGIARQRFFDEFFSKKRHMDDLVKLLQHLELELKKTAKTFREVDEKAAGDFNQMGKLWDAFQRGSGRAAGDTIFDPLKKAWNQTSDFFGHLVEDPMDALEDAKYGLRDFVESSIDNKIEKAKNTYEFIGDLWNDPIGTLKHEWDEEVQKMYTIRNVLSDWYVKNIEYGNAESITESIAYGATTFALAAVGTKGAGAVGNSVKWNERLSSLSEFQLGSRLEPAFAGGFMSESVTNGNYLGGYSMFARPSWKASENEVGKIFEGYTDQVAFKDRREVSRYTKGSTRPDFYTEGHGIEVKNYDVSTKSRRTNLVNTIVKQVNDRVAHLPEGTKQTIIIDIRGQTVSNDILREIRAEISKKANTLPEIVFIKED